MISSLLNLYDCNRCCLIRHTFIIMKVVMKLLLCLAWSCVLVESYSTVRIPSGTLSTLESYLCDGQLQSSTSLQLDAGEHRIRRGTLCVVSNVRSISISGMGSDVTFVHCVDENPRGFRFSFVQNVTLEKVKFIGCGQITENNLPSQGGSFTSHVVLFFNTSSLITLKDVTVTTFFGIALVGYRANGTFTMREFRASICASGNCSGVLIYADTQYKGEVNVFVERCWFEYLRFNPFNPHKTVFIGAGLSFWGLKSAVVRDSQFNSLESSVGGAISCEKSSLVVENCSFMNNTGRSKGAISAGNSNVKLNNSLFAKNSNWKGEGGALYLTTSSIHIFACRFENNTAGVGGAVFVVQQMNDRCSQVVNQSVFTRNRAATGAAIFVKAFSKPDGSVNCSLLLAGSKFIDNDHCACGEKDEVKGAAVYISDVMYTQLDGDEFSGNSPQGAVQVLSGNVHISGRVEFINNVGDNGGALCLSNNAVLYFRSDSFVKFSGNRASGYGGALYVQGNPSTTRSNYARCAINFLGQNDNFTVRFNNNTARQYGGAIYATPIYNCDLTLPPTLISHYQKNAHSQIYASIFTELDNNQILSYPVKVNICSCDNATECSFDGEKYNFTLYPGGTIRLYATLLDSENHISPSVVYADIHHRNTANISLGNQQKVTWLDKPCDKLEYDITGPENSVFEIHLTTFEGDVPDSLSVSLKSCEWGFTATDGKNCTCSPFLTRNRFTCDATTGVIRKSRSMWIGQYRDHNILAAAQTCPLDYCEDSLTLFSPSTPDQLCRGQRTGVLCGRCQGNYSVVFGSSECRTCSNLWLVTIVLYALLGVVLVAVLFALNVTVTQGTIQGLIFYANIIQVNSFIFFNQTYLEPLRVVISFINLDLGFALCFYDGMDDAAKIGLQFVFPGYLLILTVTFIVACRYFPCSVFSGRRLDRFSSFVGKRALSVLATLIYLSYSKLLRTVISIFTVITINVDHLDKSHIVWFYDGNIKFTKGKHLPLFLVALAVTIFFLLPYTIALTMIPIIERYSDRNRIVGWLHKKASLLKPMNDAYYAPYKGAWRSWLGARLWLLMLLYILTSSIGSDDPSLMLCIHAVLMILFLFVQAQLRPFSCAPQFQSAQKSPKIKLYNQLLNLLDCFYMVDYSILALTLSYMIRQTDSNSNASKVDVAVAVLVSVAVLMFCATFLYHVISTVRKVFRRDGARNQEFVERSEKDASIGCSAPAPKVEMRALSVYSDLREPLIETH